MTTVTEIARKSFDSAAAKFSDVIKDGAIIRTVRSGEYDPATGAYPETTQEWPCRVLFADEKAMADTFPAYVIGPSDRMIYVEGLATAPKETDNMIIGAQPVIVTRVGDIVGVGRFFSLIVRNTA